MPDENLQYAGNSNGYVPAVRDAINSRAKRTLRQLFPPSKKHVDAISSDGSTPYELLSLLEHYIRKTNLKAIVRSDLVAGDVTGQWGLMFDWIKSRRRVTELVRQNPIIETIDGEDVRELELPMLSEEQEETEEHDITDETLEIIDFAIEDFAPIPPTENDVQKLKIAPVRLRISKERMQELFDEGTFVLPTGADHYEELKDFIDSAVARTKGEAAGRNREKKQTHDAGIKTDGTTKHALVYMYYMQLEFEEGIKSSGLVYALGPDEILGIIKNPLWSGKVPIISEPVDRVKGSFMGKSKIEPVKFMQWNLCDFWNMGQDSAMYSLLPIWAVDPMSAPQWAGLTMGLAAMWPVDPNKIKPMTQPQLYKESLTIVDAMKRQIWESMEVNEMMMGKMPAGRKNNQLMGQVAQEQQTNISDHAERYEEVMLSPALEMIFEFDQQYRTEDVMVQARGEIGVKAEIKRVPPTQWGERYVFQWVGTAFIANTQRVQQQIALMNVLKGTPPQLLNGRRLDITPILELVTENTFGPEITPRILIDERDKFTIDPEIENEIMHNGMLVEVHPGDDDMKHIQAHMMVAKASGDENGVIRGHIEQHVAQVKAKRMKQAADAQGAPGGPGGAGPGVPGTPRPGAQPAPGRPMQQPPGAVQTDNMAGAAGRG
jgi:hypothetical protein